MWKKTLFLQALSTEEILKRRIKDCFRVNGKQSIAMQFLKFKNHERKIESSFMIYSDFESILVPEKLAEVAISILN